MRVPVPVNSKVDVLPLTPIVNSIVLPLILPLIVPVELNVVLVILQLESADLIPGVPSVVSVPEKLFPLWVMFAVITPPSDTGHPKTAVGPVQSHGPTHFFVSVLTLGSTGTLLGITHTPFCATRVESRQVIGRGLKLLSLCYARLAVWIRPVI